VANSGITTAVSSSSVVVPVTALDAIRYAIIVEALK
jgi:hypothetical protein